MARKRKSSHNPNQMSLFDLMVNNIEEIREENLQDDLRAEASSQGHNAAAEWETG